MSQPFIENRGGFEPFARGDAAPRAMFEFRGRTPLAVQYLAAVLLVAAAVLLGFVVENLIAAPNLTLIFVLPVIIAATSFGWGPALAAAVLGVLSFDFFFTAPYFSFRIASASDIWAASLLLVIAAVASSVAAEARRRAVEARSAAEQAQALQALAHAVIEGRSEAGIVEAAATALNRIFRAPSVVFMDRDGALRPVARAGGADLGPADEEAARGALDTHLHVRAGAYPYDRSSFDFWPVVAPNGCRCALGLDFSRADRDRPEAPEPFVEAVAGYLAVAVGR